MSRRLCLVFTLMLFGCTHAAMQMKSACPGGSGSGNPNHPLICIDDTTLYAHPNIVRVNDMEAMPGGGASSHPVMIHWWTKSGSNNLGVYFTQKGCVDWLKCNANAGHCWAQVKDVVAETKCAYTVNLDGSKNDPVIIVQPCCSMMEVDATKE